MRAVMLGFAVWLGLTLPAAAVTITVDISDQMMTVDTGSHLLGNYRWKVSTGRAGFATPKGKYRPYLLKKMHYSRKYDNAPMPHSVFYHRGYAIHATPHVKSLGRPASHGCVRLSPGNAKTLFNLIRQAGMHKTSIRIVP
jgi:lipoprotein-anchoring transpeptidase ErfK/SrfK